MLGTVAGRLQPTNADDAARRQAARMAELEDELSVSSLQQHVATSSGM